MHFDDFGAICGRARRLTMLGGTGWLFAIVYWVLEGGNVSSYVDSLLCVEWTWHVGPGGTDGLFAF